MVGKDLQVSLVASLCALSPVGGIKRIKQKSGILEEVSEAEGHWREGGKVYI